MKRILKNADDLKSWEKQLPPAVEKALENIPLKSRLMSLVETLDKYYGKDRDLERDLGGYCVVLYGRTEEVLLDREKILNRYHLSSEDYELEDVYEYPERNMTVCFQLFLCSSDYGIEIMMIMEQ